MKRLGYGLSLLWLLATQAFAVEVVPLRFGSVAMDSPAVMQQRLLPLTSYLSLALGRPVVLKLSTDMHGAINALLSNSVDFAYLTPIAYVNAYSQARVQLAVKTIEDRHPSFNLAIIARSDSPVFKVSDLAGKRFAFGDPAALLQRAVVKAAGLPLQRLGEYSFLNHYDNVVRGVLVGDYDAGIVPYETALRWQKKGLRILYASQDLPPYNITASARLDHDTLKKLRDALLQLNPGNPAHKAVIAALDASCTGFAAASNTDYDIIRKLIAPFKK